MRYPEQLHRLLNVLRVVNLELTGWLPGLNATCLGVHSFVVQLQLLTWLPIFALLLILLAAWVVPLVTAGRRPSSEPSHFTSGTLSFATVWIFVLYPSISSHGFRAVAPCDCFLYTPTANEASEAIL